MRHREPGLAGAGRADAEHQLRTLQRPHIGVLIERAGIDRALARRDLGGRHLALALQRWQRQLVVRGNRHAHGAVYVGLGQFAAFLQDGIKMIERAARLLGSGGAALDG
jgi:hypothetical protein